jgi:hypothetical protein
MHPFLPRPLSRRYPTPNFERHPELRRFHPDVQPECRHCPGCSGIYALNSGYWYVDQSRRPWADRYYLPFCKRCRVAAQAYRRSDPEKADAELQRAAQRNCAKREEAMVLAKSGLPLALLKVKAEQRLQEKRERKAREDRYALVRREHRRMAGGYSECRDWVKRKIRQDCETALMRRLAPAHLRSSVKSSDAESIPWEARLEELRRRHRGDGRRDGDP